MRRPDPYQARARELAVAAGLDPATRTRVLPPLMWPTLNWFRWASLVAVLSGFAYFGQIAGADEISQLLRRHLRSSPEG